jgi:hypothetical protein
VIYLAGINGTAIWHRLGYARKCHIACSDNHWDDVSKLWYRLSYDFMGRLLPLGTPIEKDYQPPKSITLLEFEDGQLPEWKYTKTEFWPSLNIHDSSAIHLM